MIDYIISFPDEATAHAALSDWRYTHADTGKTRWEPKRKCGIIEISIIHQHAVWDYSDTDNPVLTTPQQLAAGFWMSIATPEPDDDLWSQPYCLSEHDRDLANQGQPHLLRTKLTEQQITDVVGISPVFAGSNYPF